MLADGEDRWTAKGLLFRAEKMLETGKYEEGFVLEDAPQHNSIEELLRATPEEWDMALSIFVQPFIFEKQTMKEVFTPTIIPEWKLEICRVGGKYGRYGPIEIGGINIYGPWPKGYEGEQECNCISAPISRKATNKTPKR